MVKVMIKKLIKLRDILVYLQRWIFKIFFNHGEGNDNEISQVESPFSASSKVNFQNFLQPWWRKYRSNKSNFRSFWSIFKYVFSKFSSTMVKVLIKKLVKLKVILVHLQRWIFKMFFNHGEGNDKEISQVESPFSASSKVNFQNFLQPWWRKLLRN